MQVEERVLSGIDKLSENEQTFLVLLGELANDLTSLRKLLTSSFREPPDPLEHQASAVVVSVLLKLLGARVWQSWELLRSFYQKKVLAESAWLHGHSELHDHIKELRRHFPAGCVWDRIRDKFAYHYDPAVVHPVLAADVLGGQFVLVSSEKIINTFFVSSEMAVLASILGVHDDQALSTAIASLIHQAADLSSELLGVIRDLFTVFAAHVVNDLGGSFQVKSTTAAIAPVAYEQVLLPLFAA